MLEGRCARISQKSTTSAWLSLFLAAGKTDYVDLNMDLIEGRVRYRKGKKWKTRWAVLRRVNPATDVLNLVLYPKDANPGTHHKEKALLSLKGFSGLQVLNKMDKHFNIIVIVTTDDVIPLSFETIDQRAEWLALLQDHYGKEKSFEGIVPHKQKIKSGEAVLRFYSTFFSLTKKDSYRLIGHWKLTSLPKYGAVDGGFAFQAGPESPAGDKPVIYFFATRSGREIQALFDSICRPGEAVPGQELHSAEASQPGTSEEDAQPQPSFLKRAWLRMSGKRKGKGARPRSRSMPSLFRGKKKAENTEQTSPPEQEDNKPTSVRRNESVPAYIGASSNEENGLNDVFEQEQPKSPAPGYENIAGVTPEGYEVMLPDNKQVRQGRSSSSANSPTRKGSQGQGMNATGNERVDGDGAGEAEGYVVVEGQDEELLEKIRAESNAKEKDEASSQRRPSQGSESGRLKSSSSASEKRVENVIPEEEESEKQEGKLSETEKQGLTNGEVQCRIVVTPTDETDEEKASNGKEMLMNGHQDIEKLGEESKPEVNKNKSKRTEKAVGNADYVNGDITQHKNNVKAAKNRTDSSTATSVSTRRGLKNPPMLHLPPTSTAGSAEHLYVNSPKVVDYVNVQGGRSSAFRSRGKTSSQSGNKSKLNPYAMYDGNDDSIYHSVESLMPSHPGYQNVFGDDPSRSHSFENIAGHSYANVAGAQPSYQNIGHFDRSYVNVMSRPHQGNLNYVKVAGVDSSHATSPVSITSTSPKSSDYTWIDERKTKLLQDTAKMHSERRQENLPRVMKK